MTDPNPEPQDCTDLDDGTVAERLGCPRCGEVRLDYLAWLEPDYEEVECQTCGKVYTP